MMKLSPDDPKLTAYTLGELDKAEAAEVECALAESEECRKAVAEIRDAAARLKLEFSAEPPLALMPEQKQALAKQAPPANVVPLPHRTFTKTAAITAIAASLMCVLAWQFWSNQTTEKPLPPTTFAKSEFRYPQNEANSQIKAETAKERVAKKDIEKPASDQPKAAIKPAEQAEKSIPETRNTERELAYSDAVTAGRKLAGADSSSADSDRSKDSMFGYDTGKMSAAKAAPSTPAVVANQGAATASQLPDAQPAIAPEKPELSRRQLSSSSAVAAAPSSGIGGGGQMGVFQAPSGTVTFNRAEVAANGGEESAYTAKTAQNRPAESARAVGGYFYDSAGAKDAAGLRADGDHFTRIVPGLPFYPHRTPWLGDTARYPHYLENSFESVLDSPLSTFSIDVDTACYANVRRFLNQNQMPPADAVRIEELINYFNYSYPQPKGGDPFSVNVEVAGCPWSKYHRLVCIGLKGKEVAPAKRPPSNFVFLIDVSGSMQPENRLPLIKQGLRMLVKRMTENDRVAIVVYSGNAGIVLDSTSCADKEKILEAIDQLEAGGSTNGGEGIQTAYRLAEENLIKGGVNRVILCTDGDFNVGITSQGALVDLIKQKARKNIFLSALGVGTDNYKDSLLQNLADKGNGNYHYLDSVEEAEKVLIEQMNGTLMTIAKDVKIQVEFNPAQVKSYRLIGYEKRALEAEDFNNDKKDAGEIGAGHTVTALYEVVPANVEDDEPRPAVDNLKYQQTPQPKRRPEIANGSKELLTVKLRYKQPLASASKLIERSVVDEGSKFSRASGDFRFAAAVAAFGMALKDSQYKGDFSYDQIIDLARSAKGNDSEGHRAEFITLVNKAKALSPQYSWSHDDSTDNSIQSEVYTSGGWSSHQPAGRNSVEWRLRHQGKHWVKTGGEIKVGSFVQDILEGRLNQPKGRGAIGKVVSLYTAENGQPLAVVDFGRGYSVPISLSEISLVRIVSNKGQVIEDE